MANTLEPDNATHGHKATEPSLRFRSGFAVQNIVASASFVHEANQMESQHRGESLGPFWDEIRWKVTAAIVMSATALEANINEHLIDDSCLRNLEPQAKSAFINLLEPKPTLEKYQFVAEIQSFGRLDEGMEPYQSAKILVKLRNAIIHFVPEWADDQTLHARVGQMLQGRFQPSPYFRDTDPLFPDRCMSADCARWATTAALNFIQDFYRHCDTPSRFTERHLERISSFLSSDA